MKLIVRVHYCQNRSWFIFEVALFFFFLISCFCSLFHGYPDLHHMVLFSRKLVDEFMSHIPLSFRCSPVADFDILPESSQNIIF
jgi:hypothetical protein